MRLLRYMLAVVGSLAQFSAHADELDQALPPVITGALVPSGRPVQQVGQRLPQTPPGHWVDVIATAYSPEDPLDGAYRSTKGKWRYITADGRTDVRRNPYGIAVPKVNGRPLWAYGTKVVIPEGLGYVEHAHPDRTFTIDDTGSALTRLTQSTGTAHIDLRFKTSASARAWAGPTGHRTVHIWIEE